MSKKKRLFFIFAVLFLSLVFAGLPALATNYTLEMALPGTGSTVSGADAGAFLANYLTALFKFGFYLLAFLAVAMIVYGGIMYMVPGKTGEAKEKIWGAVIGVFFLMCSYLILQTIDPGLTNLKLAVLTTFNVPNAPHAGYSLTIDELKSSAIYKGTAYKNEIGSASKQYSVTTELIEAVIMAESSGQKDVCSSAGACGLMQLMPGTFKQYSGGLGEEYRKDPQQNVAAGTKYLAYLLKRYNGDTATALAAYNAGEGAVDKYCGGKGSANFSNCNFPSPPLGKRGYQETIEYVPKVLKYMQVAKGTS